MVGWRRAGAALMAGALAISASTAIAQPADTLRIGNWDFPPGRGNAYSTVSAGVPQVYIWPAMFDALTFINAEGAPTPLLATTWRNVDPRTWRVTLRPNVKFHNGEVVSAKTVTDAFAWFKTDTGKTSVAAQQMNFIAGVEAVGPLELEFKTTTPRPIFANLMAGLYLVPEKAWAEQGPEKFVTNPIGTGAFRVTAWTNEVVRMEAARDSWRPPKVAKLEILRLAEQAARLQALLSGQIDVMIQANADEIPAIERGGHRIDKAAAPALMQLAYVLENVKQGVDNTMLKDKRVRHALNYAVNKDAINKALMGGAWTLNTQFTVPGAFGYDKSLQPWPYDPAKAKQLLTEAGYASGFTIAGEVRDFFDIWGQVTQDLAKVGVKLELKNVVQADWLRKFLATTWEGPSFGLALGFGPEMDASRVAFFQSCRKNPPHYCNREVMPILDAVDGEFDVEKRRKLLHQVMAMMREDSPALMLFEQVDFTGVAKRVQGFKSVNRIFNFHELALSN